MDFEEKTLKRESKFKGHIFEVAVDEVLLPDGKTAGRELIFHKGAVAVLAITPEGKLLLSSNTVRQLRRFPTRFLRVNWKSVKLAMKWLQQRVNLKRKLSIGANLN